MRAAHLVEDFANSQKQNLLEVVIVEWTYAYIICTYIM